MAKYDPLRVYLERSGQRRVRLRFSEIEQILSASLPKSASRHRAWWSNESSGPHVQARAWMESDYRVEEVDLSRQLVVFQSTR
jgi:hypothetical protein